MRECVTSALVCDNLHFQWPGARARCLLLGNLTLASGEALFLHGPSGCGKSTLLSLIAGVLVPQGGTLQVLGEALPAMRPGARDAFRAAHLGVIFQQFNLLPYLSALDNIVLPCRLSAARHARLHGRAEDEARRLAQRLDLDDGVLRQRARELSVGQQQRVAAARALIGQPALVIADEPTSALDAARQAGFIELLLGECAANGASLLFVSHDQRLACHFDRAVAWGELMRGEDA